MHLLGVVLGDLIVYRENELQIVKLYLGWISNIQSFPTSYHELNFDSRKYFKIGLKVMRPTCFRHATHLNFWLNFQLPAQIFGQFGPVLLVDEIFELL